MNLRAVIMISDEVTHISGKPEPARSTRSAFNFDCTYSLTIQNRKYDGSISRSAAVKNHHHYHT